MRTVQIFERFLKCQLFIQRNLSYSKHLGNVYAYCKQINTLHLMVLCFCRSIILKMEDRYITFVSI